MTGPHVWHASIVAESEFEIIEVDGFNFESLDDARAWARERLAAHPTEPDTVFTASVTEGRMVDLGYEDEHDWVFEPSDNGRTEYVDAE